MPIRRKMFVSASIEQSSLAERDLPSENGMSSFSDDLHESVCSWLPPPWWVSFVILPDVLGAGSNPDKVAELELLDVVSSLLCSSADLFWQLLIVTLHIFQRVEVVEAAEEYYPIGKRARVTPSLLVDQLFDTWQYLCGCVPRTDVPMIFEGLSV